MLFSILRFLLWLPGLLIYPTRVIGRKNIEKKGKMIFSPNHQTLNDAVMVALFVPRRFRYMAKASLFHNPIFGWFLKRLGAYPVHSGQNDLTSVKKTLKYLKEDRAVCIFPEGTRLTTDEKNQLQHGVVMFSLKSKAPIVPAMFMKKTLAFRTNILVIGQPVKLYEREEFQNVKMDKETLEKASAILKDAMYALKREYVASKQRKVYIKYQKRIINLEIKKAKAYTFTKIDSKIDLYNKRINTILLKRQNKMLKIK